VRAEETGSSRLSQEQINAASKRTRAIWSMMQSQCDPYDRTIGGQNVFPRPVRRRFGGANDFHRNRTEASALRRTAEQDAPRLAPGLSIVAIAGVTFAAAAMTAARRQPRHP
jgi:hypothetical protein